MSLVAPSIQGVVVRLEQAQLQFVKTSFTTLYAETTGTGSNNFDGGLGFIYLSSKLEATDSSFDGMRFVGGSLICGNAAHCLMNGAGFHLTTTAEVTITRTRVSNLQVFAQNGIKGGLIYHTDSSSSSVSELTVDGAVLESPGLIQGGVIYTVSQPTLVNGSTFTNIMLSSGFASQGGALYAQSVAVDIRGCAPYLNRTQLPPRELCSHAPSPHCTGLFLTTSTSQAQFSLWVVRSPWYQALPL